MDSSSEQLPIILPEKKNTLEMNKINESSFVILSKTLKEIEQLTNSIPITEENNSIIESLKQKIYLSQNQLSDIKKSKTQIIQEQNQITNNQNNTDSKMDLMLNKIDIT